MKVESSCRRRHLSGSRPDPRHHLSHSPRSQSFACPIACMTHLGY